MIMKSVFFALSFASLSTLFTIANSASLTLYFPGNPDSSDGDSSLPTPTVWVDPIGTASDGSETTFIMNEIDSGDVVLFGDVQSGTEVVTTSYTVIASASGFILPNVESMSIGCSLESSASVGCVYAAPADAGGTDLVTVTETGFPISMFDVSISSPTQAATSESGSGSESGSISSPTQQSGSGLGSGSISSPTQATAATSGSASGSGGGSSTPSSTSGTKNNGAVQLGPGLQSAGLVGVGLLVGFLY